MTEANTDRSLQERLKAICVRLWGADNGEALYQWMCETRPPYAHHIITQVMVPIWEMNKVDLRTKILCCIALFTGLNKEEVKFFFQMAAYHGIPQEEVEEIVLLAGIESGFPNAEKAILFLKEAYEAQAAKTASAREQ
jgi:alkylhydroperoxidase/carboxymuconolactone decarboxylase family protein YurZ